MNFILPLIKIFDKMYARNLVRRLELAFPYLFCRIPREHHMFLSSSEFLAENSFLLIPCVYFQFVENFDVALTLLRHSDANS